MQNFVKIVIINFEKKEKSYGKQRIYDKRGGASPLGRFNKGFGWLSHDNTLNIGVTCHVILNLFQDLIKKRSRNTYRLCRRMQAHTTRTSLVRFAKCGMTLVSCNSKNEANAKSLELNEITTSCATPRNDKYVSEAHIKELNVLTSYRLNDFKKKAGATHVDISDNIRRVAFTLAEVLITLGIIGVVAAMTIPTLVANFRKAKVETDLKTSYSILQNLVKLSTVENGDPSTWGITNDDHDTFDKYFLPYLKGVYNCDSAEIESANETQKGRCQTAIYTSEDNYINSNLAKKKYILSNGIGIMYRSGGALTTTQRRGIFWIDISRGDKLIMGKNVFTYNLVVVNNGYFVTGTKDYMPNKSFCDSAYISRSKLINNCKRGASVIEDGFAMGLECTAMIECNGWKIPEDYPRKF